ncbi:nucleoside-diphosphate sugar epimerase [Bacillus sp. FJAT-18019]|uniref:Nucleoside-diphosphate sugar epimerase n=2 Tax=Paenibacillus solani TaxID=1705565 RepID=A0A0M1P8F2_9BACL|nr:nucleoside-diphosphate sugar epimerase [Bacillus sp. FJAT-18019]KOR90605.1 nucleoside-diphosphate sugar epimerase [Paenibacillus solani]
MVEYLSHSQQQLARILEAQRHAAVRMAQIIHSLPNHEIPVSEESSSRGGPSLGGQLTGGQSSGTQVEQVNSSITAYLSAMADLQQTSADSLEIAMKELKANEQGEE